jgi:hypothetical protein
MTCNQKLSQRCEIQSSNSEKSDLRFEAGKPVFVKRDMGVYMINLYRDICKPVLKLIFLRRIAQWSSIDVILKAST